MKRRCLLVLIPAVALVLACVPAEAKGRDPVKAVIRGPGLVEPIVIRGNMGMPLGDRYWAFALTMFGSSSDPSSDTPLSAGDLGPRYLVPTPRLVRAAIQVPFREGRPAQRGLRDETRCSPSVTPSGRAESDAPSKQPCPAKGIRRTDYQAPAASVAAFADHRRGMTLAELVRTAALDLATGFPDEIVVVLGGEVAATAAVANFAEHLMPSALSVLALG